MPLSLINFYCRWAHHAGLSRAPASVRFGLSLKNIFKLCLVGGRFVFSLVSHTAKRCNHRTAAKHGAFMYCSVVYRVGNACLHYRTEATPVPAYGWTSDLSPREGRGGGGRSMSRERKVLRALGFLIVARPFFRFSDPTPLGRLYKFGPNKANKQGVGKSGVLRTTNDTNQPVTVLLGNAHNW